MRGVYEYIFIPQRITLWIRVSVTFMRLFAPIWLLIPTCDGQHLSSPKLPLDQPEFIPMQKSWAKPWDANIAVFV